ncbi:MAG TPA: 50S ribosomal protein L4 [Vicinamibacterales bacterium]|jgi:large subunit ribosomal protein L4|nr:50S ribosomal protein L4 [Vicinamibacterales bacterium]
MKIDVYNSKRETVGSVDLSDDVFGGRVKTDLIWEAVVQENAAERRGTHATKNRALVSGSGKKPWRQKGTGRARVGEIRNPLWRKGGTVFGPQPRSYEYELPRKVKLGALRAAIAQKVKDGAVMVVDKLEAGAERKTKETAAMFETLGAKGKTLVIDVKHEDGFMRTARNLAGVRLVVSSRVTARDVIDTNFVIVTREALEKLQASLG